MVIQGHNTVPLPAPETDSPAARMRYSVKRSGITTTEAVKTRQEPVPTGSRLLKKFGATYGEMLLVNGDKVLDSDVLFSYCSPIALECRDLAIR